MELIYLMCVNVAVFVVIVYVLYKLLYTETTKEVMRLKQLNAELANDQSRLSEKLEQAERDYKTRMSEAEDDAQQVTELRMQEARVEARAIETEARAESDRIVQAALKGKETIHRQIEESMSGRIRAGTEDLLQQVLSNGIRQSLDDVFLQEAIVDIGRLEERDFAGVETEGVLRSASPLAPDVRQALLDVVNSKMGRTIKLADETDESLMAGVVMRVGDLEIDASLKGRISELSGD